MTPRAIARRYATALFDVARQRGEVDRVGHDLSAIRSLISAHPELQQVFDSAAVPAPKKRAVVEALLSAGGEIHDDLRRLLLMLAERDRLTLINDLTDAYAEKAMTLARIIPAEVTTAVPLGEEARGALARALSRATDSEVTLTERVDPAIIGGLVAKVGSVVFDGSVVRQLDKIRDRLQSS